MKKTLALILFFLLSISLLAVPYPESVSEMFGKAVGVFIHAALFLALSLFSMLNVLNPKKKRTNIMTVLLVVFTIIFACFLFSPDALVYDLVYLFFIVLDIFFLTIAFVRIGKQQNSGR